MKERAIRGLKIMSMFLASAFAIFPAYAQETGPTKEYKGLFQIEVKASGVNRGVVEELGGGLKGEFNVESARFYAQASIKPLSPLEIYILGGTANLRIANVSVNKFYGRLGPYYGAGFRASLYESPVRKTISFFLDGSVSQITSKETGVLRTYMDTGYVPPVEKTASVDEEILLREYAFIFEGKGRFAFPGSPEGYAGMRFSRVEGTDTFSDPISHTYNFTELGLISLILGADFYLDPREMAALNVELGLGDPLYITGGIKFWF